MSLAEALKEKVTAVAQTAKIADLQRDIHKPDSYHTNDLGVKVPDTDNWSVVSQSQTTSTL